MKFSAVKAILSTLLLIAFLILVFSGALLYFGKTGVVWGISRYMLRGVHFCAAVLICICAPVHLFLNRKAYKAELRSCLGSGRKRNGS